MPPMSIILAFQIRPHTTKNHEFDVDSKQVRRSHIKEKKFMNVCSGKQQQYLEKLKFSNSSNL